MAADTPSSNSRGTSGPSQVWFASVFALRMAASHGLTTYLVWLAFTSKSASTAGWVLVARAVAALVVPMAVGRMHDRGSLGPWLKLCAVIEAGTAVTLAWAGWHGTSSWVMVLLSLLLGSTASLFDTVVYPMLLAARPGTWRPHVLVGLSYDVAKVIGSSLVLALLVVWHSPFPVMAVSMLALAGWRLQTPHEVAEAPRHDGVSPWRVMEIGPVIALATVSLLPGQVSVFQVASAHGSFWRYAVLGTLFAVGAVTGNFMMQRLDVSRRTTSLAYVSTAGSLTLALVSPFAAFLGYGVSVAVYYQMTRVLVIEAATPTARGRVSAAMTAATKIVAVAGSVLGASLVHRPTALYVTAASIAVLCAVAVHVQRRWAMGPATA